MQVGDNCVKVKAGMFLSLLLCASNGLLQITLTTEDVMIIKMTVYWTVVRTKYR